MINKSNKSLNLDFEEFFSGKVVAKGNMILHYPKKSIKDLDITFKGFLKNNQLKLTEYYSENNKKTIRNWKFKKLTNNLFHGTEKNVKGNIVVNIEKNRLSMNYYFKLMLWNFTFTVLVKDYMYLVGKNEIINITYVSKFGIKLAKVILLYKKKS
ncbi:MAG: hypothetical protein CFH34_00436 [Alphaproteobacteria bacterium MarineAlpha9_Bin4]|nr:hypothetical protein [Pelagibacterales bacterium]PPR27159.1 MAG: hypothetical protein CFH34_00436 [Alphaproteobacteria bacterium MarineAlpha9_Bin4]